MKVSKNFYLQEFVSPDIYKKYGDSSIWFIDQRLIIVVQILRNRIGMPLTINNWPDGNYKHSGFREPSCPTGAELSQHRFGRASDLKILGKENNGADIIRDEIKSNWNNVYKEPGLTTIEHEAYASVWAHIDIRYTGWDYLKIVKP